MANLRGVSPGSASETGVVRPEGERGKVSERAPDFHFLNKSQNSVSTASPVGHSCFSTDLDAHQSGGEKAGFEKSTASRSLQGRRCLSLPPRREQTPRKDAGRVAGQEIASARRSSKARHRTQRRRGGQRASSPSSAVYGRQTVARSSLAGAFKVLSSQEERGSADRRGIARAQSDVGEAGPYSRAAPISVCQTRHSSLEALRETSQRDAQQTKVLSSLSTASLSPATACLQKPFSSSRVDAHGGQQDEALEKPLSASIEAPSDAAPTQRLTKADMKTLASVIASLAEPAEQMVFILSKTPTVSSDGFGEDEGCTEEDSDSTEFARRLLKCGVVPLSRSTPEGEKEFRVFVARRMMEMEDSGRVQHQRNLSRLRRGLSNGITPLLTCYEVPVSRVTRGVRANRRTQGFSARAATSSSTNSCLTISLSVESNLRVQSPVRPSQQCAVAEAIASSFLEDSAFSCEAKVATAPRERDEPVSLFTQEKACNDESREISSSCREGDTSSSLGSAFAHFLSGWFSASRDNSPRIRKSLAREETLCFQPNASDGKSPLFNSRVDDSLHDATRIDAFRASNSRVNATEHREGDTVSSALSP